MRYARHLISLVAAFGLAGVAHARPQEEEQEQLQDQNQNQPPPPPMCCEEVTPETAQPPPQYPPQYQYPQYQPQYQPPQRIRHRHERWRDVFSPNQVSLVVGGGGVDFMSERLSSLVHPGPMWNVRLVVGTRSWIAFEAAYVGTMNKLIGGLDSEPHVMSNGLETDLRVNFWTGRVQPYGFGGIGYAHWTLHNRDRDPAAAALWRDSDDQFMVPAGAGLSGYLGEHFVIDTRFTYRALFKQNFVLINEERNDQWTVQANLGIAF